METQSTEQIFVRKAVTLVKGRDFSADTISELLEELKVGENQK